ncbi:phosphoserine phosphatase SerB [Agrococcus sp. SGAir0287]|uniref:phosphoserine phosphatase SerB n=1 Tax=Agrococcus sp. SGAir0287 TaxID=2070347 RepID=UPI0010CCF0B8|nr:phosphoserine phosphatase SerB [Agrococcus sp. SGAir0287]QCR19234.1 phosphoserine phosphatase SerB [Agrococcus sp. SGAir0287]
MRRVVVTDVDSTLIRDEVIELIADAVGPDARRHVEAVTTRAMLGELDFAASLVERVRMLEGVPATVLDDVARSVTVTDGVVELVEAVHASGGIVGAVSGGFHEVLDPLAERLGLDRTLANRLEVDRGHLTGRTVGPIVDAAAKREALHRWAEEHGVPLTATVAIGDGANDLLMLEDAGIGVAFCAKPVVRERVAVHVDEPDFRRVLALLEPSTQPAP